MNKLQKQDKVLEARKYRIYPDEEQVKYLNHNIFANIKMWNALLAKVYEPIMELDEIQELPRSKRSKAMYKHIDKMSYEDRKELFKSLRKVTPKSIYDNDESVFKSGWTLKDADTTVYSYTKRILQQAIDNHLKNPKHFGVPRFKTTRYAETQGSYACSAHVCGINDNEYLKLGKFHKFKLGTVKMINQYPSDGRLYKVTITHEPSDIWYVSFVFEQDEHTVKRPKTGLSTGIDLNVTDNSHIVLTDGKVYQLPYNKIRKLEQKIEKENVKLSRKYEQWKKEVAIIEEDNKKLLVPKYVPTLNERGNYQKNRKKIAKLHNDIKNIKQYYIKTTCSEIANKYDVVVMEDLNVSGMTKNHHLARAVTRANFREIRDTLTYMLDWADKQIVFINRWSPTSKKCNECGYINNELTLKDREWTCPSCHVHHIRDVNAAKNIHDEGMKLLEKMDCKCKKCGKKRTVITEDTTWTCTKCNSKNK